MTIQQKMSKSKNIKIEFIQYNDRLSEIMQSTQMQFAFITDDYKQCHDWVLCRDFLHDAVRTRHTGEPSSIYGFHYTKENPPISLDKMYMAIKNNNSKIDNKMFERQAKSALRLVNLYEGIMGIEKSELFEVEVENINHPVWLFIGSNRWLKAPQLVSMYTFLIRLGNKEIEFETETDLVEKFKEITNEDKNVHNDNDIKYLKNCYDKLGIVARNEKFLFEEVDFNSFKTQNINTFHNNGGIWSLCTFIANSDVLNNRLKSLCGVD